MSFVLALLALGSFARAAALDTRQALLIAPSVASGVPDYFQTTATQYAGPTATGQAPFLVQSNPAPFSGVSYIPNAPLETQVPIAGNPANGNFYRLQGQISHYFPNPSGFGVEEYPLPPGTNVTMLNMLSRHAARYPTTGHPVYALADKIRNASGRFRANGDTAFLNDWTFKLGTEILVPVGHQELFDSGVLHYYQYGHLVPEDGSKIVVRSTTQARMRESAEYFLAGFFGLGWTQNATLELIIEGDSERWNNTLAGQQNCPNSGNFRSATGNAAAYRWIDAYLRDVPDRLNAMTPGLTWTIEDAYNAQSMCALETVGLGYSAFCKLFTYPEWEGYEYSVDLAFAGNNAFQSPTGRAVGIGYVEEFFARLDHRLIAEPTAQINTTLDSMNSTFPTNQSIYFDFTHDTNIISVLTAFGLKQFDPFLPPTHIIPRDLVVSHMTPFSGRLDIEILEPPRPVRADRTTDYEDEGGATTYVHFLLNQRTIPLGKSYAECGQRADGWCEMRAFRNATAGLFEAAKYEYSCFGDYDVVPYGKVTDGVPIN